MSDKAGLFLRTDSRAEAPVIVDALIAALESEIDPEALTDAGIDLLATGIAFFRAGRLEDALRVFAAITRRFDGSDDRRLRMLVAHAMSNTSQGLARLGQIDDALAIDEDMVSRYGEDALAAFEQTARGCENQPEQETREELASVLLKRAVLLSDLEREDDAEAALTDLVARFDVDDTPLIRAVVATAQAALDEGFD